jgi:hypothetical protein
MVDVFVFSNKPTELEPSVRITGVVDIPFEFTHRRLIEIVVEYVSCILRYLLRPKAREKKAASLSMTSSVVAGVCS